MKDIKILKPSEVKFVMIVMFADEFDNPYARNWIVLPVTMKDIKRGTSADSVGLYAFGGFWYGKQPTKIRSYGKISPITSDVILVERTIISMSNKQLKQILK